MNAILPAALAAALLLVTTGTAKLRRPDDLANVLYRAGMPQPLRLATGVGSAEIVAGAVALMPVPYALVGCAVLYAVFSVFVSWLLVRRVAVESCGCAGGRTSPPPTWLHVVVTSTLALVCALAAPVTSGAGELVVHPSVLVVAIATILVGCYGLRACLLHLPPAWYLR